MKIYYSKGSDIKLTIEMLRIPLSMREYSTRDAQECVDTLSPVVVK